MPARDRRTVACLRFGEQKSFHCRLKSDHLGRLKKRTFRVLAKADFGRFRGRFQGRFSTAQDL
jgi:hypothetical protein